MPLASLRRLRWFAAAKAFLSQFSDDKLSQVSVLRQFRHRGGETEPVIVQSNGVDIAFAIFILRTVRHRDEDCFGTQTV